VIREREEKKCERKVTRVSEEKEGVSWCEKSEKGDREKRRGREE